MPIKTTNELLNNCSKIKPFVTEGREAIDGIIGIAAAIGGKTPDIDDDVSAAIARAAFAARLNHI